jgi:two-component sensor histidine kinase
LEPTTQDIDGPAGTDFGFLAGGGAAARLIAGIDWAATPLGPVAHWPVTLKVALGMALNSRFPKALVWGPSLTTFYNDAFKPILGAKPEAMGRSFAEVWAEAWDRLGSIAERAFAGEATFIEDYPVTIERHGHPEDCHFTFCYSPIRDPEGRVVGMMDTVIETTGKVAVERSAALMNAELQHRLKNSLSVVSSIARQTLRSTPDARQATEVLGNRLQALAETHGLLSGRGTPGAMVGDVVRTALAPYVHETGRIDLDGPPVRLNEKQALALALAINELATNALKYGALSVPEGKVTVTWRATQGSGELLWAEHGGPPVTPPDRTSFGTLLLSSVIPGDFGGTGKLTYAPEGLRYRLTAEPG